MGRRARLLGSLALLAGLACCGVDGPPVSPSDRTERPEPGITLSGSASIGVVGGSGSTSVSRQRD